MLKFTNKEDENMTNGLEFDPGFAPYIMAFQGTVDYLYNDINKFKNFSQKKTKFRQYYKKFLELFYNNLGFYAGCLMWAAYIKEQEKQPILNNYCLGQEYNEDENTGETDFMITFAELFPKDVKYFMGETYEFEPYVKNLLDMYREFLIINKGFINTKENTDIELPKNMNTKDAKNFKEYIDASIKTGDLKKLTEHFV